LDASAGGRRKQLNARVEDSAHADPERGRRAENGEDLPRRDLLLKTREKVGLLERTLREEPLHQSVVALRDPPRELLGDRPALPLAVLRQVTFHPDQIDRAAEALLLADRDLQRNDAAAVLLAQRL